MSEMIERVARVLEPQAWAALSVGDTLAYANRRKSSLRKAILVIKEMRELTDAMIKAASANLYASDELVAMSTWPDMIDEALKEKTI